MWRTLLILLTSTTALAAAPKAARPDQAKKYLEAAVRLYNAFEFERALEQLTKARASSQGADLDVTIELYEGMLQLELGRDEQAETAFKTALSLDPAAALPTRVSPKVQQLFDRLKDEMAKPVPATPPKLEPAPAPVDNTPLGPLPPSNTTARRASGPSAPGWWWAPGAGGAVLAGVGTVFLFQAKDRSDKLRSSDKFDVATAMQYRDQGKLYQGLGFTGLALGVALVAVSVLVYLLVRS
jgi:tetratricopeptide (TPR) repeat protein